MSDAMPFRPGVKGPSRHGAMTAAGVIGLMGFYGLITGLQKTVAERQTTDAGFARFTSDARDAVATASTPSLVYAVTDAPPPSPVRARAPRPALPEPVIDPEPTEVRLVAVTPEVKAAPPIAVSEGFTPSAETASADVSTVTPQPAAQ